MAEEEYPLSCFRSVVLLSMLLVMAGTAMCFSSVPSISAAPPPPPDDTPPSLFISADPTAIYADGVSTATINVSVWDGQDWIWLGQLVNFSADNGTVEASAYIVQGAATVIFTAGTEPGVATITAEAEVSELGLLTNTTTVTLIAIEFDTGAGSYPTIPGTHRGIIKPSHPIVSRRISLYSCAGTGGHIESVTFSNATTGAVVANHSWHGYQGDYHTIAFPEEFVLEQDKEYRYELVTGSYPQMIYQQQYNTSDGSSINCTEFVDVNGNVYGDCIPSFWLGP
jgi:hypothetical protein